MIDHADPRQRIIELIVAIVDRGKGKRVTDIFIKHHAHRHFICLGIGTASSEIMDYLGLGETEKDIVLTLAPKVGVPDLFEAVNTEMQLKKPGKGIMFTVPLSGIGVDAFHSLIQTSQDIFKKDVKEVETNKQEETVKHDLILAILNQGFTEGVMAVAREAGATGGTVIHGRNVGLEGMDTFLGIHIEPEKDVLLIVTKREDKPKIMKAVNQVAGSKTECQGFIFSLPVNSLAGLT
ncbi:MAG: P-II family nitrogen regulator [Peptococcaceae bacterium]|jgi:nitrogen regulatory protein PII|nr:P-II family nitrogen regulator [Peptococcaceae bacterium]